MTTTTYSIDIPIRDQVDVLVCGGGPAGVAAALAAAGQGATVHIIENSNCLGGMGTIGLVPAFMPFTDGVNFLAGGIGRLVLDRLEAAGGVWPSERGTTVPIKPEVLKRVYDDLCEEAGVAVTFHARAIDVQRQAGRIERVICAAKSGLFAIAAKAVVDGTGDGDICAHAGAPFDLGDEHGAMMPTTLCSIWAEVDWQAYEAAGSPSVEGRIEEALADGVLSVEDRHLPGMWPTAARIGGGNVGHCFACDGTDERSLTAAYIWGRRSMREYEQYYRRYIPGHEQVELVATAALMGVRETRRIRGDYQLNSADFRPDSSFPDEIGRFSYPIDIHLAKPDKASFDEHKRLFTGGRLGRGEHYGIPYRILTPQGLDNVLVAGRCVSTDRSMQASIRVMPGCFITGQAAGIAAAMVAAGCPDIRAVDITDLQARLRRLGAFLP